MRPVLFVQEAIDPVAVVQSDRSHHLVHLLVTKAQGEYHVSVFEGTLARKIPRHNYLLTHKAGIARLWGAYLSAGKIGRV